MTPRRPLGRAAGFSFIEILVVMGIIAVLAGLGVVIINVFVKRGPKDATRATVAKLKGLTDTWKLKYSGFPPGTLEGLKRDAGLGDVKYASRNGTNEGIETLFQALHVEGFGASADVSEAEVGNTDDDKLQVKLTNRGPELREFLDGWGNPLVYFGNLEYAKHDQNPPTYISRDGEEFSPRPWRDSGGGFVNPNGFQVFSIGEDGQPNTDDDVKAWD